MKELSEAYADAYNMADRIIKRRLNYEREFTPEGDKRRFEVKSKYEKAKIANNMKLAKRKLHLRNKFIKPIIEDDKILNDYSRVTLQDRKKYLSLVQELYLQKHIQFENSDLLKHINREFRYPILGKISRLFGKKEMPMLNAPASSFNEEKKAFNNRIEAKGGVKTNAHELGIYNKRRVEKIKETWKGNETK
jgi:hypothetical protein